MAATVNRHIGGRIAIIAVSLMIIAIAVKPYERDISRLWSSAKRNTGLLMTQPASPANSKPVASGATTRVSESDTDSLTPQDRKALQNLIDKL